MMNNDERILAILRSSNEPLSSTVISVISGIRHDRVCKKLEKLSQYSMVKCVTKKEIKFWKINE
jgi:DNA-binding transcriptional regulator GbsR (MarR family)